MQHQSTKLRWGGRAPGARLRRLGPVASHKFAVPADHRRGLHDQHHVVQAPPIERTRQHREHGPVRRREPRPIDLSLQDQDLMAKSENLSVARVAAHQQQADTGDEEPKQVRENR